MKRAFPALLALLCATLALLIATSSSPLYAANFWTDTNIYFTIGRGMTRGLMPYRDLFDHKGPLLFMLYALGAAISDTSFIGVFILEVLSLAAAVYAGWRTVSLFGEGRLTLLSMPILAAVVCCCTAFTQGGSAEEFALPALAAGVYLALALMARPGEADGRRALGFGAAAGWVFLIKYTDIGLFAGLGIGLLAFAWRRVGFGRALVSAGRMLLGALLVCAPVAAYLAANGALAACVEVYFIQNLFDYSGAPMSLSGHVYNALAYLRTQSAINPAVVLLVALGMAFLLLWAAKRHGKGMVWQALALPMGAGLLLLIPLVVLLFRRTLREAVVALSGAILPLFFAGFIHWAAGGRFDGPVRQVAAAITSDSGYRFFDGNTLFSLIAWGVIFFLLICSAAGVLLDIRTLKTKPRNILFYNLYVLCVVAGIYFVPYSSPVTLTLAAPAAATLIPVVLTKFNSAAASMFYTVLILLSLVLGLI